MRRDAAAALGRLAEVAVAYADARIADDTAAGVGTGRTRRIRPGEFVADELALLLRDQPYQVRCLIARSRRLATGMPTVWEAFRRGELDAEQIRIIDRVARRVTEATTLAALDEQAVAAAQTRSPKQLQVWLLRLVVQLEPLAFQQRHGHALAERRVTVVQGADGIGYVTGEVSAADAGAIDAMLAASARNLGADDPAPSSNAALTCSPTCSLAASLSIRPDGDEEDEDASDDGAAAESEWLEVENIDPDTGEFLGTQLQPRTLMGSQSGSLSAASTSKPAAMPRLIKRPQTNRIGVLVPLASLLGSSDTPAELADRSGFIAG